MLSRRLAKLLFCIALLAQIAAPVMGVGAMAAGRDGRDAGICDPSLNAHALSASPVDPGKAGRHGHHGACVFCPVAGVAPLASAIAWADPRLAAWIRLAPSGSAQSFVPEILKLGSAPRAPPSLV